MKETSLLKESGKGYNFGVRVKRRLVDRVHIEIFLNTVPVADERDRLVFLHDERGGIVSTAALFHYTVTKRDFIPYRQLQTARCACPYLTAARRRSPQI